MKIRPIILCGGAGTRLWPKSKKNIPKQFIDWGGWTLFDKTLQRIKNPIFDYPIITTNLDYLKHVKRHLFNNKIKKSRIILEPLKKNTAPAILSSALIKEIPNNQPMIFITSDNLIEKNRKFNKYVFSNKKHLNNNNIFI
jgi:mannose-1-phosphate guanylyltransferase